jgi:hypothetical protein
VLCRLPVGARLVTFASVHLESHSDPDERAAQLEAVFDAIDAFAPGAPALVGGDVNSHSLSRAELADRALLSRALEADPRRLAAPIAHEPLFARAERRGYDSAPAAVGSSTERRARGAARPRSTGSSRGPARLGADGDRRARSASGAPLRYEAIAVTIRCA